MLNSEDVGRSLAKVVGSEYDDIIISVNDKIDDPEIDHEFRRLKIPHDGVFQQIPDSTKEREIIYITGCSGSGKSTYTRKFIEQHKKKKKDMQIYLFSALPDDESLDSVKPQRILLDESLISDPIDVKEFAESIVIFNELLFYQIKRLEKRFIKY